MSFDPVSSVSNAFSAVTKSITGAFTSGRRLKHGDQSARDTFAAKTTLGAQSQYSAEFRKENKNWFDSLIDGYNRIPRPAIVSLVVAYFITSFTNPEYFKIVNDGLTSVPEPMWYVLLTIIGFYFGARHLENRIKMKNEFSTKVIEVSSPETNTVGIKRLRSLERKNHRYRSRKRRDRKSKTSRV